MLSSQSFLPRPYDPLLPLSFAAGGRRKGIVIGHVPLVVPEQIATRSS